MTIALIWAVLFTKIVFHMHCWPYLLLCLFLLFYYPRRCFDSIGYLKIFIKKYDFVIALIELLSSIFCVMGLGHMDMMIRVSKWLANSFLSCCINNWLTCRDIYCFGEGFTIHHCWIPLHYDWKALLRPVVYYPELPGVALIIYLYAFWGEMTSPTF